MIDFLDEPTVRLQDSWREKLIEAECRYTKLPDSHTRAEYFRMLKLFTKFVFDGEVPEF